MQFDAAKTVEETFKIGDEIEKKINDIELGGLFDKNKSMVLENEKVLENLLLLKKKAYVSMKHEWDPKLQKYVGGLSASGVKTVKRNNAKLIKDVSTDLFESVVKNGRPEDVSGLIRKRVSDLLENKLPIDDLVTSGKLSNWNPKNPSGHVNVAKKRRARGEDVALGDRIPYYVTQGAKKYKISDVAEDPEYGKEHKIPGNADYYINAVKKAVHEMGPSIFNGDPGLLQEFNDALDADTYSKVVVGKGPLTAMFGRKIKFGPKKAAFVASVSKPKPVDKQMTMIDMFKKK